MRKLKRLIKQVLELSFLKSKNSFKESVSEKVQVLPLIKEKVVYLF
jgi:hypothetical protein